MNLSVATNLDIKSADIVYTTQGNGFHLRENNAWRPVRQFNQQDIDEYRLGYRVNGVEKEELTVRAGERVLKVEVSSRREVMDRPTGGRLMSLSIQLIAGQLLKFSSKSLAGRWDRLSS